MVAEPTNDSPLLSAALAYAARGWRVFPLQPRSKKPFSGSRGLLEATTDEATIRRWWIRWPSANVGIACGQGLGVIDEDTYKGGDTSRLSLPATLTATTPRGGKHLLYSVPGEIRPEHTGKLGRFVDYQGDGAYIVAPPSRTTDGTYAWVENGITKPQPMPSTVLRLLAKPEKREPVPSQPRPTQTERQESDGMYWADRAAEKARSEGRNNAGAWLAQQLRDNRCLDPQGAMAYYASLVGEDGDHPYTEREAWATMRSIDRRPPREPARSQNVTPLRQPSRPSTDGANALRREPPEQNDGEDRVLRFQFVRDSDVENMPPPRWLIGGHLVAEKLSVVYGEYGSAKSFLTLDWALCVATGMAWNGHPVERGLVAYVAGEGIGGMGKRIKAWKLEHGWQEGQPTGLWLLGEPPQLLNAGDVLALREAIASLPERPSLVVIDTLARSMVGGDENSAQDMGLAVAGADTIRREFGCHVLLVHHKPANASKTRGSTALPGAADTTIEISKDSDLVTVRNEKQKDFEPFATVTLNLKVRSVDEYGEQTSCVLVPSERQARHTAKPVTKAVQEIVHILLDQPNWQARYADLERIVEERGIIGQRSISNALKYLEDKRHAKNHNGTWRLIEPPKAGMDE